MTCGKHHTYSLLLIPYSLFLPRHKLVADVQAYGGHIEDDLAGGFVFVGKRGNCLVVDGHPLGEIHIEVEAEHEVVARIFAVY